MTQPKSSQPDSKGVFEAGPRRNYCNVDEERDVQFQVTKDQALGLPIVSAKNMAILAEHSSD